MIGLIASRRLVSFRTASCATKEGAMLSSLPSSHPPLRILDGMPSETTKGHDGDVCSAIDFAARRPMVQSASCDCIERVGPGSTFLSACSLRMWHHSDPGHLGQHFSKWRMPCFLCVFERQNGIAFPSPPPFPPLPPPFLFG